MVDKFHAVHLGMTTDEVVKSIGQPEKKGSFSGGLAESWVYSDGPFGGVILNIRFSEGKVVERATTGKEFRHERAAYFNKSTGHQIQAVPLREPKQ